ncbi:MAG: tetratricopeptide repeat protein, partial [Humidesulfovibrio sp.]|nr:tetratricopeptide repeat protein [Humidesulfovibrio sp.]
MDEKKDQAPAQNVVQPGVVEQLEQIKNAPDDTAQQILDFLVGNLKAIAIGCGVVILIVAAYAGMNSWRGRQAAKSADALGVILIQKTEPKARVDALEAYLKDAPSSLRPTALLELAASAMVSQQYAKASVAWAELEGSSSADMKVVAGIGHAKSLLLEGKAAEALTLLQALKTKSPKAYELPITR